jgi:importin-7
VAGIVIHLQHQHMPGQLTNLLRVAVEDSVDAAVRQVAAITFKNLVKADWDAQGEHMHRDIGAATNEVGTRSAVSLVLDAAVQTLC